MCTAALQITDYSGVAEGGIIHMRNLLPPLFKFKISAHATARLTFMSAVHEI